VPSRISKLRGFRSSGVLEEVTDVIDELGVSIIFIKMSRLKLGARSRASIFIDLTSRVKAMKGLRA